MQIKINQLIKENDKEIRDIAHFFYSLDADKNGFSTNEAEKLLDLIVDFVKVYNDLYTKESNSEERIYNNGYDEGYQDGYEAGSKN